MYSKVDKSYNLESIEKDLVSDGCISAEYTNNVYMLYSPSEKTIVHLGGLEYGYVIYWYTANL